MDNLHWQLSILSKAIHYKNLSGAAAHVGVSQPQLSRIISRLEGELDVILLDRTARRKSGWTPIAYKIADTYFRSSRKLTQSLLQMKTDDQITQISIGFLEGLLPLVNEFCSHLFEGPKLQLIELNVYDLSELEERFEKDELDLVFTCREPSRHKFRHIKTLGYQNLEKTGKGTGPKVFSQFEYANEVHSRQNKRLPPKDTKVLLSNSLAVRRRWIEELGATGFVPSEVRKKKAAETDLPVILIGSDMLNSALWQKIDQFRL